MTSERGKPHQQLPTIDQSTRLRQFMVIHVKGHREYTTVIPGFLTYLDYEPLSEYSMETPNTLTSRDDPGAILGRSWGDPGAILGRSWGDPGAILGRSWGDLGAILGRSWGDPGAILGRSWGDPGAILGRSRGDPGAILGRSRGDPGVILE